MTFFEKYVSASTAGTGNQSFFYTESPEKVYTARAFFKTNVYGAHGYSFLFSNIIDSTFSDGSHSGANRILDEWYIESARTSVCDDFCPRDFSPLTFDGAAKKTVAPGEFFATDEVMLSPNDGQYICIELAYRGTSIPFHPEVLVPIFTDSGNGFEESKNMPMPAMIGCNFKPKKRIAFWGDSITQGIGTEPDSYRNYASVVAKRLGKDYAYWDIGIGYARTSDAATDGAWAFKAKQNDIVSLCFGVNDIYHANTAPVRELEKVVDFLKKEGIKVVLHTVPPFDYDEFHKKLWNETNDFIRNVLAERADGFLDCEEFLSESRNNPERAKYGGHPDARGNEIWGNRLADVLEKLL